MWDLVTWFPPFREQFDGISLYAHLPPPFTPHVPTLHTLPVALPMRKYVQQIFNFAIIFTPMLPEFGEILPSHNKS